MPTHYFKSGVSWLGTVIMLLLYGLSLAAIIDNALPLIWKVICSIVLLCSGCYFFHHRNQISAYWFRDQDCFIRLANQLIIPVTLLPHSYISKPFSLLHFLDTATNKKYRLLLFYDSHTNLDYRNLRRLIKT